MSKTQNTPIMNKKVPTGKAIHRKSRVNVPTISISPSTQKLLDDNDRIVSTYNSKRKKRLVKVVVPNKMTSY